jgi:hypothetical protein
MVPKLIAVAGYCAVVLAASYAYHASREAPLSPEDEAKVAVVTTLATATRQKLAVAGVLSEQEALIDACFKAGAKGDVIVAACYWDAKNRFEAEQAERVKLEFAAQKEKAAALAAAATAAKILEDYQQDIKVERSASVVALSEPTTGSRARADVSAGTTSDEGRGRSIIQLSQVPGRPYRPTVPTILEPVYAPKPTGPVIPGRLTRNGAWVPGRQMQN